MFEWTLEPNLRVYECFKIIIPLCDSLSILSKKEKIANLKRLRHTAKGHRSTSSCFGIWLDQCSLLSAMYECALHDQRVLNEITTMLSYMHPTLSDNRLLTDRISNHEQAWAITDVNYAKPDAAFATEMLQNWNILRKQGSIARNWLKLVEFCPEIPDVFVERPFF